MKIVAVRHLPTPWNLEGRLQGQQDIDIVPLDDDARNAIVSTRKLLDVHAPFDRVFCSTLKRTKQSAEAYGFSELTESALLDELNFGPFEGQLSEVMLEAHGHAWHHAPHELAFGETMTGFGERVRRFLAEHRALGTVLVFGHGGWMRALRSLVETGSIAAMNQRTVGNGEILVFVLSNHLD